MKATISATIVGLAVSVVTVAHAQVNLQWVEDSYTAFDLVVTGTGESWSDTLTSPSGLWQLEGACWGGYSANGWAGHPDLTIDIGSYGKLTFLENIPPSLTGGVTSFANSIHSPPYNGFHPPSVPIQDGNGWLGDAIHGIGEDLGWGSGERVTITITATPVLEDPTTWLWTEEFKATGQSLVPEPGSVAIGLLALLVFAPKMVRRLTRHI